MSTVFRTGQELNIKLSEKAYKDSDVLVAKLTKQFVFVMVIVLMIATVGGIFIVRSIIAPLTQTIDDLGKLAKGDLQPSAPPSGQDELTNLQQSMHSTRTALRDTVQVILSISENLSTSAASLSAAGHQVMTSSGMQAQAIASSAASIEEMSVSISQLSDSANGANEQALKAGSLARQGEQQVENVAVEIKTLTNAINQSAAQIRQLAEDVAKISQITVLIKGVADQTNLLALNAAIEAARAGDMGRGFAVVADEVRQLAERTSKATQEIDGMISGVQTAASSTVSNMDKYIQSIENVKINTGKANEIIGEIDQSSEQVVQLMDEVNVMLKEQSSASQLIAQSVEEVNNMSQENVAASESVNGEALRITQIVNELKQSVAVFKLR